MAVINTAINERRRVGVRRSKKHMPKTDMTPMVDLGFLLITFFVITMELNKPATLNLNMPKGESMMDLGKSNALTVLLDKDNVIYYYHGDWDHALKANEIFQTNFSKDGFRKVIHEKQQQLDSSNTKEKRKGLMLLIKAGEDALYSNVIDMLDEALINDVKKYVVLKLSEEEMKYLLTVKKKRTQP